MITPLSPLFNPSVATIDCSVCSIAHKGEHDGAGAVIKRALTHEQLKADGVHMNCAHMLSIS